MKTQVELAAQAREQATEIAKIGAESTASRAAIDTLKEKVAELEAAAGNQTDATQELTDAVQAVSHQLKIVDDIVPDAPETPPAA